MKYIICLLALTFKIFALDSADQKAIHQIIEQITLSWNEHACHGFGDHYADDADFVNIFGMAFAGKKEIETRHIKILETFLKDSHFEVTGIRLREAKPDIVIAHVQWLVTKNDNGTMKGVFTHIFLKTHDKWEITASQNTLNS